MEKQDKDFSHLFVPLEPEKLLNGRLFLPLQGQIIFHYNDEFVITNISEEKNYTAEDYFVLPEGAPYQLINEKLVFMVAPTINHQDVSLNLTLLLAPHIKSKKLGKIYYAPTDLIFGKKNIIQPDIIFISIKRKEIITEKNIQGAPNLVVEILSHGTEKYDRYEKLELFGKHGVEECWLVDLKKQKIEQYFNMDKKMQLNGSFGKEQQLVSKAIEGFVLQINKVFE